MRSGFLLLCPALLLTANPVLAQTPSPAAASQWGWGARLGVGYTTGQYRDGSGSDNNFSDTGFVGGLTSTRYFAGPRASLGFEALIENQSIYVGYQQATPFPDYHPQTLTQWQLFMPLYLRTGTPANWLHLLAGAGPTFRLGQPGTDAAYYPRPAEFTLLLGADVRLAPWHRYETTLGFRIHAPLTPSYSYGYPFSYTNQGIYVIHEARQDVYSRWIGLTLGTTLHPAALHTPQ